ncbi:MULTISPECIES: beta-ketoacyl synthase N-terminal-like domain-containing protein [Klebsiella]|uniref:beta-ketoacyl synthase N-terminal-like domain-containing protein n=1 Tax=Klebsiella TaxID=570 RepID=UPI00116F030E|nr:MULTISPECIES: beta-ketoacyl synthase N-terminal-like domain-containing protein [Klebsiella]MCW9547277.1 beta-ketoacyl synthase N-terminal-like domain-containing protein [Klebsiella oxytoca]VUS46844.1 3-oxoacyl-[acyl-carrier-protein] synthase 2 [Klebsiella grimontii]
MNNVVITGYGTVLRKLLTPEKLFNYLADGETLLCEDERLKNLGISMVPSVALSENERQIIVERLRHRSIFLQYDSIVQAMALSAILDAMEMSQLSVSDLSSLNPEFFFANNKIFPSLEALYLLAEDQGIDAIFSDIDIEKQCEVPQATALFREIAECLNSSAPPRIYSDACTAGMSALHSAFLSIRHGHCDVAVVCASEEATHPLMQLLFKKVGALYNGKFSQPKEASRAFDKSRSGCVLADASACLILESQSHALARNARPLVEIKGMYRSSEAHKMTSSDENGTNYLETMASALRDAGITPEDIHHINAHGTSTVSNDQTESRAIASLFKSRCPPVISTKSALGHSLGVSGLLECILSCESILHDTLLPSLNFHEQSTKDGRILINTQTRPNAHVKTVLSNSFGFGGENCSVILTKAGTFS